MIIRPYAVYEYGRSDVDNHKGCPYLNTARHLVELKM